MIHETDTTLRHKVWRATLDSVSGRVTITPPEGRKVIAQWDGMIVDLDCECPGDDRAMYVPAIVLQAFDYAFDRMMLDANEDAIEGFK